MWDPEQYLRFGDERARPFRELVGRIGATEPRTVVDLGCGPGTLTIELAHRWPGALVTGIDSSPEMIAAARGNAGEAVEFAEGDVTAWRPPRTVDVVVANALLQWVPGHLDLLGALVAHVAPGGWLGFQVPGNFEAPSHAAIGELRRSPRWSGRLEGTAEGVVHTPVEYARRLLDLGVAVDAWETTYVHVLGARDAVLEWLKGTTLRPILARLDDAERAEFLAELGDRLRQHYPLAGGATLYPFRRIFVVAHRPDQDSDSTSRG